jgi:hypothetical protein
MLTEELVTELEDSDDGMSEVLVEVNGVQHPIHYIEANSQGLVIIVDPHEEERAMREDDSNLDQTELEELEHTLVRLGARYQVLLQREQLRRGRA